MKSKLEYRVVDSNGFICGFCETLTDARKHIEELVASSGYFDNDLFIEKMYEGQWVRKNKSDMKVNKYSDYEKPEDMEGKTIEKCGLCKSEYGRTYAHYLLLKFTDGTRHITPVHDFNTYIVDLSVQEMQKHRDFFTTEDIVGKTELEERKERQRKEEQEKEKIREYNRLKNELRRTGAIV